MSGKQFLYIAIVTLITILIWFGVDIILSKTKVEILPEIQQMLEPINPNFDQTLINGL